MRMTSQAVASQAKHGSASKAPSQPPTPTAPADSTPLALLAEASALLAQGSSGGALLPALARVLAMVTGAADVGIWERKSGADGRYELGATWPESHSRFDAVRWLERPIGSLAERAWASESPQFARYPQALGKILPGGVASLPFWLIPLTIDGDCLGLVVASSAAEPDSVANTTTILRALACQASHLRFAEQQRSAAAREDAEFVAITAHDLKNVATAVKGYAQLLGRILAPNSSPRTERAVSVIVNQVDVLVDTLNKIVDLGRLQAGQSAMDRGPVELSEALAEADLSAPTPNAPSAAGLRPPNAISGHWDRRRLVQAFALLFAVAHQNQEEGGAVPVAVSRREGQAVLHIGEPSKAVPWPTPTDWTRQATANLHLARRLLQIQGGTLGIRVRPEGGLLMMVTLPLEESTRPI
jgi:signal transduction histidine kinase